MAEPPLQTTLDCPLCGEEPLVIMAASATDPRLMLVCGACGTGFWDPGLRDTVSLQRLGSPPQAASAAEVRRAGWRSLLAETADPT